MEAKETNSGSNAAADLAEAIRQLNTRLDRLDGVVEEIRVATRGLPLAASAAVDTFDQYAAGWQEKGIDVDDRLAAGLSLFERLTEPGTMAALEGMLDLVGHGPGTMAMLMDMVDGVASRAQDSGIDIDERIAAALELGEKMTAKPTVDGLAGVLQPGAVSIVGMLGNALVSCYEECMTLPAPRAYTPLKAIMATRDPDVQTGLAFLVNVARFFGQQMKSNHARLAALRTAEAAPDR